MMPKVIGLTGQTGSGKSTLARLILRFHDVSEGSVSVNGTDVRDVSQKELRGKISYVPQKAWLFSGTIADNLRDGDERASEDQMRRILSVAQADFVSTLANGLDAHVAQGGTNFSGGQKQRIGIARALAVDPKLIICDEPVSALDASVRAQVLNLMRELKEKLNLTYIFISHDLSVVHHICDRVAVMYLGRIVEIASKQQLYSNPVHPYTKALLSAIPIPDPELKRERIIIQGDVPSPANPPSGCHFHKRCPYVRPECSDVIPPYVEVEEGHHVLCCLAGKETVE